MRLTISITFWSNLKDNDDDDDRRSRRRRRNNHNHNKIYCNIFIQFKSVLVDFFKCKAASFVSRKKILQVLRYYL